MSNDNTADEKLLKQVDDRLEHGQPSDHAIINTLAEVLLPVNNFAQSDATFQDELEARLIAQLQQQHMQKEDLNMVTTTTRISRPNSPYSYLTWAAALIVIVLAGSYALTQSQRPQPALPSAVQVPTAEPTHSIVIATKNIEAGTTITNDMVGLINLSETDFEKLQKTQPDWKFFTDLKDVVGQTSTTAMFWFEPVAPIKLGQFVDCSRTDLSCIAVPNGLYTISLPLPMTLLSKQGMVAGDRVDVLTSVDNQLSVVAEDVLLTSIKNDKLTFAATSWKQSVLIWLWQTKQPYVLSPHQGDAPKRDDKLVDYSFTSPETLPDNYKFQLIAGFPDSKGYQLVGSPYALDDIQFTQRDTLMQFWFTKLKVVSITDGTKVVINLPASDAANLDFLLKKGAALTFIPQ